MPSFAALSVGNRRQEQGCGFGEAGAGERSSGSTPILGAPLVSIDIQSVAETAMSQRFAQPKTHQRNRKGFSVFPKNATDLMVVQSAGQEAAIYAVCVSWQG